MNLISISQRFPDQQACIKYLEEKRWGEHPRCPHCGSQRVGRKQEGKRIGRWNCHGCKSSFNVLSGTIFERTMVPLPKWFLAIGLMVNAKKSLSSCQLARDVGLNTKTAWFMQQRIRAGMAAKEASLLKGIVEVDETYVGGQPRKENRREDDPPGGAAPRGRATGKAGVIGAVERGGRVVARVARELSGKGILRFFQEVVSPRQTVVITDAYAAYRKVTQESYHHAVINHSVAYADGCVHTNTIEGFWSLLKRAWYGSHHHYSKHWLPLFVAEASWKYNHRHLKNPFDVFLEGCFA